MTLKGEDCRPGWELVVTQKLLVVGMMRACNILYERICVKKPLWAGHFSTKIFGDSRSFKAGLIKVVLNLLNLFEKIYFYFKM